MNAIPAIPNCRKNLSKSNMTAISAPYNFVPLARWVHIPAWSKQASHDWPFEDGYSGEIHYRLIAESPILVGGQQKKIDSRDRPNTEVRPFQLPVGTYAIPGSSLKGMLRSVVEIAGFGRMRMVDDVRPGLRDISGKYVAKSYTDKVRSKVKTGFLRLRADGGREIVPCRMVRLDHRTIENDTGAPKPVFEAGKNVGEKYNCWQRLCRLKKWDPMRVHFDIGSEGHAKNLGKGEHIGYPVFTGQISDSTTKNGKKKDFVFFEADEKRTVPVTDAAWRDFLYIHGDDGKDPAMSWPGYWRARFRAGDDVPVFYLQDGGSLRIGLAYMPKLAGDFSTQDAIRHASEQHLQEPGPEAGYDLADLLFGAIHSTDQNAALRGRVSCELAKVEGNPEPEASPDTILNGPKPSYFPNYLEQKTYEGRLSGRDPQYATYVSSSTNKKPVIRGFKRYPARPDDKVGVQQLTPDQRENKKVQIRLHPLPAGTVFKGRIVFHNLKPEEVGALLWAMTWGGDDGLRHGIGMGKPFGFGQVRFEIDPAHSRLIPNDPEKPVFPLDPDRIETFCRRFTAHMNEAARAQGGTAWEDSPQIRNLLAMADPESADNLPHGMELRHMCLNAANRINEFLGAKQEALVLNDYVQASGWPTRQTQDRWLKKEREGLTDQVASGNHHPWLQTQLEQVMSGSNATDIDGLMRHKKLFKAWKEIEELDLKREVLAEIKTYWEEQGWWNEPPTKSVRQLKTAYEREEKKL